MNKTESKKGKKFAFFYAYELGWALKKPLI